MQPFRISQNIIPVSVFKAKAAEWLRHLAESSEPVVITQNGKAAAVVLSPAAYDELTESSRFRAAVEQGLADVEAGRVTPHEEVVAEMRRRLGGGGDDAGAAEVE
jgi:prevent-host-death family protein